MAKFYQNGVGIFQFQANESDTEANVTSYFIKNENNTCQVQTVHVEKEAKNMSFFQEREEGDVNVLNEETGVTQNSSPCTKTENSVDNLGVTLADTLDPYRGSKTQTCKPQPQLSNRWLSFQMDTGPCSAARDMAIKSETPLSGIASCHPLTMVNCSNPFPGVVKQEVEETFVEGPIFLHSRINDSNLKHMKLSKIEKTDDINNDESKHRASYFSRRTCTERFLKETCFYKNCSKNASEQMDHNCPGSTEPNVAKQNFPDAIVDLNVVKQEFPDTSVDPNIVNQEFPYASVDSNVVKKVFPDASVDSNVVKQEFPDASVDSNVVKQVFPDVSVDSNVVKQEFPDASVDSNVVKQEVPDASVDSPPEAHQSGRDLIDTKRHGLVVYAGSDFIVSLNTDDDIGACKTQSSSYTSRDFGARLDACEQCNTTSSRVACLKLHAKAHMVTKLNNNQPDRFRANHNDKLRQKRTSSKTGAVASHTRRQSHTQLTSRTSESCNICVKRSPQSCHVSDLAMRQTDNSRFSGGCSGSTASDSIQRHGLMSANTTPADSCSTNELKGDKPTQTNQKLYFCKVCGKGFNRSNNLLRHERIHSGDRPFICGICNKTFAEKRILKLHHRTHTGEKPYFCQVCGKSFPGSSNLKEHERVHSKPHRCKTCGKDFARLRNLRMHERAKHLETLQQSLSGNLDGMQSNKTRYNAQVNPLQ